MARLNPERLGALLSAVRTGIAARDIEPTGPAALVVLPFAASAPFPSSPATVPPSPLTWEVVDSSPDDSSLALSGSNVALVSNWATFEPVKRLAGRRSVTVVTNVGGSGVLRVGDAGGEVGAAVLSHRRLVAELASLVSEGDAALWELWGYATSTTMMKMMETQCYATMTHVQCRLSVKTRLTECDVEQVLSWVTTGAGSRTVNSEGFPPLLSAIERASSAGVAGYAAELCRALKAAVRDETLRRLGVQARAMAPGASRERRAQAALDVTIITPRDEFSDMEDGDVCSRPVADGDQDVIDFLTDPDRVLAVVDSIRSGQLDVADAGLLAVAVNDVPAEVTAALSNGGKAAVDRLLIEFQMSRIGRLPDVRQLETCASQIVADQRRMSEAFDGVFAGQSGRDVRTVLHAYARHGGGPGRRDARGRLEYALRRLAGEVPLLQAVV